MDLGFAVKVLGPDGRGLPTADLRKAKSEPSLGVSIERTLIALEWVKAANIHFWRLPNLVPYGTHAAYPQFHDQPARFDAELMALGDALRAARVRVTEHPGQYTVLGSPRPDVIERSVADLVQSDEVFTRMGFDAAASPILIHAGGRYGDPAAARERLLRTIEQLPEPLHARLCLENDDRLWSAVEVAEICQMSDLRMIWDLHHHRCHNPEGISLSEGLDLALSTWPADHQPKVHLSSGRAGPTDRPHADHIDSDDWRLLANLHSDAGRDFDVMCEVKLKDHAVIDLGERIRAGDLPQPAELVDLPRWP